MSRDATMMEETLLHAYADGLLEPAEAARVEAWLGAHPERAAEIAAWHRQNMAIRALFDPIAGEPVPERLKPARIAARKRLEGRNWRALAAAAAFLFVLGGAAGWFGHAYTDEASEESPAEALIAGAVAAHTLYAAESRHAVEVPGAEKSHLDAWLSNRLQRPIAAPDLTAEGFSLLGGRLLPPVEYSGGGPAALLMYQDAAANRLTVFITANPPDSGANLFTKVSGLEAFYWANKAITCTVVGRLPAPEMKLVASQVFHQLSWKS